METAIAIIVVVFTFVVIFLVAMRMLHEIDMWLRRAITEEVSAVMGEDFAENPDKR